MTLPSLLPIAGAAVPALERVIDRVAEGLSFLDVLHQAESSEATAAVDEAETSANLEQDFAKLVNRLRQRFAELGIDLVTPVHLKQDERDRVVVDGDHPDRVLIESIFAGDDELASLFKQIAAAVAKDAKKLNRETNSFGLEKSFRLALTQSEASISLV